MRHDCANGDFRSEQLPATTPTALLSDLHDLINGWLARDVA